MSNSIISQERIDIVRKEVAKWPKWKRGACNVPDDDINKNNQTESKTE